MQRKVSVYPVKQHTGVLFLVRSCLALTWLVWRFFFPGLAVSSSGAGWPSQTGHSSALLGLEKTQREFASTFHAGNQQKPGTGKLLTGGTPELGDVRMS